MVFILSCNVIIVLFNVHLEGTIASNCKLNYAPPVVDLGCDAPGSRHTCQQANGETGALCQVENKSR